MKRKERTQILIAGQGELSRKLCTEIEKNYLINIIEQPNNGLVMMKMRENSQRSLFYIGEVLVTECKVEINGVIGMGILSGLDEQHAYQLAVIDAAYNARLPETAGWESLLRQEQQVLEQQRQQEYARVLKTRVNFETMDV